MGAFSCMPVAVGPILHPSHVSGVTLGTAGTSSSGPIIAYCIYVPFSTDDWNGIEMYVPVSGYSPNLAARICSASGILSVPDSESSTLEMTVEINTVDAATYGGSWAKLSYTYVGTITPGWYWVFVYAPTSGATQIVWTGGIATEGSSAGATLAGARYFFARSSTGWAAASGDWTKTEREAAIVVYRVQVGGAKELLFANPYCCTQAFLFASFDVGNQVVLPFSGYLQAIKLDNRVSNFTTAAYKLVVWDVYADAPVYTMDKAPNTLQFGSNGMVQLEGIFPLLQAWKPYYVLLSLASDYEGWTEIMSITENCGANTVTSSMVTDARMGDATNRWAYVHGLTASGIGGLTICNDYLLPMRLLFADIIPDASVGGGVAQLNSFTRGLQ